MPSSPRVSAKVASFSIATVAEIRAVPLSGDVAPVVEAAIRRLADLYGPLDDLSFPGYDASAVRKAGLLVVEEEAWRHHADDLADHPEGYSPILTRMLEYGRDLAPERLAAARGTLESCASAFTSALETVDAIAAPVSPWPAFPFARPAPADQADLMTPANAAGCPAISVPCGRTAEGLPVGLQLIAAPGADWKLLSIARAVAPLEKSGSE